MWHVYILRCLDESLYVGVTSDISRRIKSHNNGNGGAYTRNRLPVSLLYTESYSRKSEALKRELQIKGWSKAKKTALIAGNFEKIKELSKACRYKDVDPSEKG